MDNFLFNIERFSDILNDHCWFATSIFLLFILIFGYKGLPLIVYALLTFFYLLVFKASLWILLLTSFAFLVLLIKPLRAFLISSFIMKFIKKINLIPQISSTERVAIEAGVLWIDKDLFSGQPDYQKLMSEAYPQLTQQEKDFIEGPVNELCRLTHNFDIINKRRIPQPIWDYIKKEKFFGMIIPKKYGGLGFSALAHGAVIAKLNSRSSAVAVTVMVPNSLGPAELLMHYGTEKQRQYYLPRLADGREIPCFALTEPEAGSDAGSIQASGVIFKDKDDQLYIKLNWNKRWITLASISTVMGIAFRLKDPDHLIGDQEDIGITCALIPSQTKGVVLGLRHNPMGVPFYNCPTQGKDVIVPIDAIIGGRSKAGQGWGMLMESLSAGRGISLPSQMCGGSKMITRVVSSHAVIRKQFGCSIGKFEGVREHLARIAGKTYMIDATRIYTLGALDKGIKPPIITAITKYQTTELGRDIVNDVMDIMGGAGLSLGPRNLVAPLHTTTPIGITVEGANILTRTLMIFGQGAMRAHPYAFKEINALENNNVKDFDKAFWSHIGHVFHNLCRTICLSLTRGFLSKPCGDTHTRRYFRKLSWISASFALMTDIVMALFGGQLKKREMLTGRFADILSHLYMTTAILRRYEAEGRRKEDLPFVHYSASYCLNQIQKAFDGIFCNMNVKGLSWFFKVPLRIWSDVNSVTENIDDTLIDKVAEAILKDGSARNNLTQGIYLPEDRQQHISRLEYAFQVILRSENSERKIRNAIRKKQLPKNKIRFVIDEALKKHIISQKEYNELKQSSELRLDAIQVDSFSQEEYLNPHSSI